MCARRHTAYLLSLEDEYTVYMFLREDNYFIRPVDLKPLLPILLKNQIATAGLAPKKRRGDNVVVINKFCGFGSYSDKIYIFTKASIDPFFAPSWKAFRTKMLKWAEWRKRYPNKKTILGTPIRCSALVLIQSNDVVYACEPYSGHIWKFYVFVAS